MQENHLRTITITEPGIFRSVKSNGSKVLSKKAEDVLAVAVGLEE